MICHMAISRRQFAHLTSVSMVSVARLTAQRRQLTAQQVVELVKSSLGIPWTEGLDGFKAGEPSTVVSGVAATAMATMDVLSRAVRERTNLIFTLEPVLFSRTDGLSSAAASPPAGRGMTGVSPEDPVVLAKNDFIRKNGLWRSLTPGTPTRGRSPITVKHLHPARHRRLPERAERILAGRKRRLRRKHTPAATSSH
jgi:hypothetical protein